MNIKRKNSRSVMWMVAIATMGFGGTYIAAAEQPATSTQGTGQDLAGRVKQALHDNPTLSDKHIRVSVKNGEVFLRGFVEDSATLLAATKVATDAAGDHKVVNRLSIKQNYPNAP